MSRRLWVLVFALAVAATLALPIGRSPLAPSAAAANLGGQNIGIRPGVDSATIIWDPGTVQNGYGVFRLLIGLDTLTTLPPGLLPASATSTTDNALSAGAVACYAVMPTIGDPPVSAGFSNLVCVFANTRTPSGSPRGFILRVTEGGQALFSWTAPDGGGQDSYLLLSTASGAQPVSFDRSATSASVPLSGLTCFRVLALRAGSVLGWSDIACGAAGMSTLGATPATPTSTGTFPLTATPTGSQVPTQTSVLTATPTRTATSSPTATRTATAHPPDGATATRTPVSTATAGTVIVGAGGFPTISSAVAASAPGSTISIRAGTYPEQVTINRTVSLVAYGDGPVWIDGECTRQNALLITGANDVKVQGLGLKRTAEIALLIERGAARANIDGNTIQDFNCVEAIGGVNSGIAAWYAGPGQRMTNNTIRRRVELPGPPAGNGDGIWFKSTTANPSGGGHYVANNTIIGGWDGIGGFVESDPHGTFDRDTLVEHNTISLCGDDGIQTEGGNANVTIRFNTIQECGVGIAFAPNLNGPLFIEGNTVTSKTQGALGALACMKVGAGAGGTTYINNNVCNIDGSQFGGNGNGIQQTNSTLGVMVTRNNVFNVTGYALAFLQTPPVGSSFDNDCLYSTDPTRFIKWNNLVYRTLPAFQTAVGQELAGRTGPC